MSGVVLLSNAVIDGNHRLSLQRIWDVSLPYVVFVMLNPSTADAQVDDPTIKKCMGFARRWGFGGIRVVNLFAYRATKPKALKSASCPVSPLVRPRANDDAIKAAVSDPLDTVIVAWGANGAKYPQRIADVMALIDRPVLCLSVTKEGQPGHPLMLPYDLTLAPWTLAA